MTLKNIPRKVKYAAKFLLGTSSFVLIGSGAALAQENDTNTQSSMVLEEIFVTATKKTESIQDVPIAVTAISGQTIRDFGFVSAIDIVSQAPNVEAASIYGSGSSATITIRGVGQNDFGEGHEAPVTTYVDEVYMVAVPSVDFALMDIKRVEVLRGPQGTLFGRNSTGGLIQYITTKPSTSGTEGFVDAGYGNFNDVKLEGAFNTPLGEKVAVRVSGVFNQADGYKKNLTAGQPDGAETNIFAFRGQLLFEASDTFTALFKGGYGRVDAVHNYYEAVPLGAADPVSGLANVDPTGTDIAGFNEVNFGAGAPNVTTADFPTHLRQVGYNFLMRLEKNFEGFKFVSLSSYNNLDRKLTEDCDATANPICFADFPYQTNWFTQELRIEGDTDKMSWTAGLYYLNQNATNQPTAVFNFPVDGPTAVDPVTGLYNGDFFPLSLAADWKQVTKSYSAFAHVEYNISDQFSVIGGVRYTKDDKDYNDFDNATFRSCPGGDGVPANCFTVADGGSGIANPISDTRSDNLFSWKIGLNYKPTSDVLLYVSLSQGTKGGGFNNGFLADAIRENITLLQYKAEKNIAYEVGFKSTFVDGRVRLNGSAFYYDYKDFQAFTFSGLGGFVTNSDATFSGAELELEFLPVDSLLIKLAGSLLDSNIKNVVGRNPAYIADRKAAFSPSFSANGSISYSFEAFGDREIRFVWDWNYVGERFTNNFNDPSSLLGSSFKHNILAVVDLNDNLSLSGYVRNISNNQNQVYSFTFVDLGYLQQQFAKPRTYGFKLSWKL